MLLLISTRICRIAQSKWIQIHCMLLLIHIENQHKNFNTCIQIHRMLLLISVCSIKVKSKSLIQIHRMLLLIIQKLLQGLEKFYNSNTSYVAINLNQISSYGGWKFHSNTSYVAINLLLFLISVPTKSDSNTSYVAINPLLLEEITQP